MQSHDVINPQRGAVLHLKTEIINNVLVTRFPQALRDHWRESPILALAEEHVRRRARAGLGCEELLILPNIESAAAHPHRQVQVKSNSSMAAMQGQLFHLALGHPLRAQM